jgi:uncharacterized membrane protein
MSVKQKFLDELRSNLRKYPSGAVDDYVDYYDELISERVANGQKEASVMRHIGTAKEVAAAFKQDSAIDQAVHKPTVSNGLKALIAVLSVLSLPLLIPMLIVCFALLLTLLALIFSGLAVFVFSVIAAVFMVGDMASIVFAGDAPGYLLLLVAGIAVVVVTLAYELVRGLLFLGKWITRTIIRKLKTRQSQRKHQHLSPEEQ